MTSQDPGAGWGRESSHSRTSREWVGGSLSAPFFIHDRAEPYRPCIVIWFELPDGLVVGQTVVMPEDARGAVASALRSALTQPEVGLPRQPHSIRVPDAATAAQVRAEVAGEIPVTVAPTPELDALFDQVIASMQGEGDEASYFEDGRVSADAIEKLFTAGRFLFEIKPWTFAYDSQVLRMDIPALGVDGDCVYVIGQLDESPGVLIFASFDGFQQFLAAGTTDAIGQDPDALGSELLALTFLRAGELPPSMRREAMEHAWPVASADAYPLVERRNPDGTLCRLVEQDIEIATACALSLSALFGKHAAMFKSDNFAPVCESYFDDDDLEVRFTVPYEAFADFDMTESTEPALNSPALATPFQPRAGRNEPCPCGSGRKYKKCHLAQDEAGHASRRATAPTHALDERP